MPSKFLHQVHPTHQTEPANPRTNPGTSSEQKPSSYSINTPLHLKYVPHMMTENASPRASLASDDLTSRRVRYFGAFTLLIGMFLYPKLAPSYFDTTEKSTADRINSTKTLLTTGFVNSSSFPRVNNTVPSLENTTTTRNSSSVLPSSTCKVPDTTTNGNRIAST